MFSRRFCLFLIVIVLGFVAQAQTKKVAYKQHRVLILLDGSSSMVEKWNGDASRFKVAGSIITRLMDSIYQFNDQVEFALRVYGHQHGVTEQNCWDSRQEVRFSKNNYTQMALRLESLRPYGVSPIAWSLQQAAENDLVSERDYAYSLLLITDGGESCGGDICQVVQSLLEKKVDFKPYIISLVDYAPLRDQYSCLGTYLQVSKESEMRPAIGTIAESYRKIMAIPIVKPELLQAAATMKSPSALKIDAAPIRPVTDTVPKATPVKEIPKTVPPAPRDHVAIAPPPQPQPKAMKVDTRAFVPEKINPIRTFGLERIRYALYWSTSTPPRRPVPYFQAPERIAEPSAPQTTQNRVTQRSVVTSPNPATAPGTDKKKEAVYTTTVEPSAETLLEIYFTDGKGKFYHTTPQMRLMDVRTGAQIKKFFRTTDAAGRPDPQKVPPGNYTLVIGKTENYVAKNVTIQAGNTNKVTVVVTHGSLSFGYDGNRKRPVEEFTAVVKKNFEPGPLIGQRCTDQREYEPGNYHIEINTLPIARRMVDLDFGVNVRVDIDEPGFVQFTNVQTRGRVSLYYPLGDQFVRFHGLDISGDPSRQKVRLQPGVYEVRWKPHPNIPVHEESIERFIVKSNETTEVEIP